MAQGVYSCCCCRGSTALASRYRNCSSSMSCPLHRGAVGPLLYPLLAETSLVLLDVTPSALRFCHRVPLGARPAAALPSTTPTRQRSPRTCGRRMCPGACSRAAAAMGPAVAATPVAVTAAVEQAWLQGSPSLLSTLTAHRWEDWQEVRVACTQIPPFKRSRWLATSTQAVSLRSESGPHACRAPAAAMLAPLRLLPLAVAPTKVACGTPNAAGAPAAGGLGRHMHPAAPDPAAPAGDCGCQGCRAAGCPPGGRRRLRAADHCSLPGQPCCGCA